MKYPSFTLISIPYFISNSLNFYSSSHFTFYYFLILITFLVSLDCILIKAIKKYPDNYLIYILIINYIIILYGPHLMPLTSILNELGFNFRGRTLITFFILIIGILPIISPILKTRKIYIFNAFILILSFVIIFDKITNYKFNPTNSVKFNRYSSLNIKQNKPILLLITDEYASPSELFKFTNDSSIFDFSNKLKFDGWVTSNESYSKEISTIHSLSSIFNYNLSNNPNFSSQSIDKIGSEYLVKSKVFDQAKINNISIINFGIFQIGESKQISKLYYYPENFFDLIIMYTLIPQILQGTSNLKLQGLKHDYYPMVSHNEYILEKIEDSLLNIKKQHIVYAHLLMPHGPYIYNDEFKLKKESLNSYLSFWNFTNKKLYPLINKLKKKYNIILTGDHGYRHDKRINPHMTYTAFYGFNLKEIKEIKVVQDIGFLLIPVNSKIYMK